MCATPTLSRWSLEEADEPGSPDCEQGGPGLLLALHMPTQTNHNTLAMRGRAQASSWAISLSYSSKNNPCWQFLISTQPPLGVRWTLLGREISKIQALCLLLKESESCEWNLGAICGSAQSTDLVISTCALIQNLNSQGWSLRACLSSVLTELLLMHNLIKQFSRWDGFSDASSWSIHSTL